MTPEHAELRERILSYEELDPDERRAADAHLAECDACTELLARVREAEAAAAALGSLPEIFEEAPSRLGPAERRAADESLHALRSRAGVRDGGSERDGRGGTAAPRRRWWPALVPVAAAAAALLVVMLRAPGREESPFGALRFARYSMDRGGAAIPPGTAWHTGDRFILTFDSTTPTYPVVFLLDPEGSLSLLHPGDPDDVIPLAGPGAAQELPPREIGEAWLFLGATGRETFFVVDARSARAPIEDVLGGASSRSAKLEDRADRVRMLSSYFEKHLGPTTIIEADHLP